jgi:hypothetical protein
MEPATVEQRGVIRKALMDIISRHFPPAEATQPAIEVPNAMSNAVHELVERWFMDDLPERARAFPSGPQRLRILAQQVISKHYAAEAGEVERSLRAEVEHWVNRYNELEQWRAQTAAINARLRVELSDARRNLLDAPLYNEDGSYTPVARNIADHARTNTISECIEKLNALSILPFDAVPYIRRDDAIAVLESLAENKSQESC